MSEYERPNNITIPSLFDKSIRNSAISKRISNIKQHVLKNHIWNILGPYTEIYMVWTKIRFPGFSLFIILYSRCENANFLGEKGVSTVNIHLIHLGHCWSCKISCFRFEFGSAEPSSRRTVIVSLLVLSYSTPTLLTICHNSFVIRKTINVF